MLHPAITYFPGCLSFHIDRNFRKIPREQSRLFLFKKLSGYQKNDRTYIADIEYDLIFKKDYEQVAEDLKKQSRDNPLNALGAGMNLFALKLRYGDFKAGDVIHQEERVTLVKTDKGWILDSR